jgi:hypothetical protein
MSRLLRSALPLAVTFSLLLSACGGPGGTPNDGGPIEHPTEADQLILRVEHVGGFSPPEWLLTALPAFSLLGDGTVVVEGAQIAIFPGPALPPLLARRLSGAGIQAVLTEVARTQLFGQDAEYRGAQNFVADAADTVFTLNAEGRTTTVRIYGLGTLPPDGGPQQLPPAEVTAHQRLGRLSERLTTLESWLPGDAWRDAAWQAYEPEALRIAIRDVTGEEAGEGMEPQLQEWPLAADPATIGEASAVGDFRCAVVEGEEAATLLASLRQANQLTRWLHDEKEYSIMPRPLLADEARSCEPPAP